MWIHMMVIIKTLVSKARDVGENPTQTAKQLEYSIMVSALDFESGYFGSIPNIPSTFSAVARVANGAACKPVQPSVQIRYRAPILSSVRLSVRTYGKNYIPIDYVG